MNLVNCSSLSDRHPRGKHAVGQVIAVVPHPDVGFEECLHVLSIVFECANDVVREEQNFNENLC